MNGRSQFLAEHKPKTTVLENGCECRAVAQMFSRTKSTHQTKKVRYKKAVEYPVNGRLVFLTPRMTFGRTVHRGPYAGRAPPGASSPRMWRTSSLVSTRLGTRPQSSSRVPPGAPREGGRRKVPTHPCLSGLLDFDTLDGAIHTSFPPHTNRYVS